MKNTPWSRPLRLIALALLFFVSSDLGAIPIKWQIDLVFSDSAKASGSFVLDGDAFNLSEVDVTTEPLIPQNYYDPAYYGHRYLEGVNTSSKVISGGVIIDQFSTLIFKGDFGYYQELWIDIPYRLSSGIAPTLSTSPYADSKEVWLDVYGRRQGRDIVSMTLKPASVPDQGLASIYLLMLGLAGLAAFRARRS